MKTTAPAKVKSSPSRSAVPSQHGLRDRDRVGVGPARVGGLSMLERRFSDMNIHGTRAPILQPKLRMGRPGDKYEREADRIANHVTQLPDRHERQQRRPTGAPEIVRAARSSRSLPLDPATLEFMEARFGRSFHDVRVHTDGQAAASAEAFAARSYTIGRDIVFGPGTYSPGTVSGKRLLAHELTHVVQQSPAKEEPGQIGISRVAAPLVQRAGIAVRARSPLVSSSEEAGILLEAIAEVEIDQPATAKQVFRKGVQQRFVSFGLSEEGVDEVVEAIIHEGIFLGGDPNEKLQPGIYTLVLEADVVEAIQQHLEEQSKKDPLTETDRSLALRPGSTQQMMEWQRKEMERARAAYFTEREARRQQIRAEMEADEIEMIRARFGVAGEAVEYAALFSAGAVSIGLAAAALTEAVAAYGLSSGLISRLGGAIAERPEFWYAVFDAVLGTGIVLIAAGPEDLIESVATLEGQFQTAYQVMELIILRRSPAGSFGGRSQRTKPGTSSTQAPSGVVPGASKAPATAKTERARQAPALHDESLAKRDLSRTSERLGSTMPDAGESIAARNASKGGETISAGVPDEFRAVPGKQIDVIETAKEKRRHAGELGRTKEPERAKSRKIEIVPQKNLPLWEGGKIVAGGNKLLWQFKYISRAKRGVETAVKALIGQFLRGLRNEPRWRKVRKNWNETHKGAVGFDLPDSPQDSSLILELEIGLPGRQPAGWPEIEARLHKFAKQKGMPPNARLSFWWDEAVLTADEMFR